MPRVNVQFHMLLDELIDFVGDVSSRYSLAVELEKFFPTRVRLLPCGAKLNLETSRFGHVDRIWLLCKPPRCRKFERFTLNIGRLRGNRLEQSDLGTGTDKAEAFKVLKKVARHLKRQ